MSVRLSPDLEERLRERLAETGLKKGEGIAVLLDFALGVVPDGVGIE